MTSWMQLAKLPPIDFERLGYAEEDGGEGYPLFNRISIETSSYCNRSCGFCPISTGRRPKQVLMPEETYSALLAELSELKFDGIASMFLLNEPTLDKRLKQWCMRMRDACPSCCIYISTNADLLLKQSDGGIAALEELLDAGVNCVNLNIYDSGSGPGSQHDRLWALARRQQSWSITDHKYQKHGASRRLVAVTDMRPERLDASSTDMFYDRTAEERDAKHRDGVPQVHCARPHRHIVVLHDGQIPLCCALDPTDPKLGEDGLIVGRFPDQSLEALWNSETMFKYRWFLQQKRRVLPGCATCTHRMSYSHVVRYVISSDERIAAWEQSVNQPKAPLLEISPK